MESKQEQRCYCLNQRRVLTDEIRQAYSIEICRKLSNTEVFKKSKTILSYMSSYDEVDPSYCESSDKTICYPVCINNEYMEARFPNSDEAIEIGNFGIRSPKINESILIDPQNIDLVIVPCVGFDEKLNRLGHGKGFYDRYLKNFNKSQIITIAFEVQKLDNTLIDTWDVPMSMVITEKKIYY